MAPRRRRHVPRRRTTGNRGAGLAVLGGEVVRVDGGRLETGSEVLAGSGAVELGLGMVPLVEGDELPALVTPGKYS